MGLFDEVEQAFQLFGDADFVVGYCGFLDVLAHYFDGRKAIAAAGSLEIVAEAADGIEVLESQRRGPLRSAGLGGEIFWN